MTSSITKPNDIDILMALDPLDATDADIDAVILYNRNQRAKRESGAKGTRAKKDLGPQTKLDLTALGLKVAAPKIIRRV